MMLFFQNNKWSRLSQYKLGGAYEKNVFYFSK